MLPLKIIDRIIATVNKGNTFAIGGHMRPDGDCIGSELAIAYALRDLGKKSHRV
jgi:phosphoesterase RecJ-like protein